LIRGVWRSEIGEEPERPPAYSRDWSETSGEERLLQAALRHLVPTCRDRHMPGQIILFRMRAGAVAKHLGIAASGPNGPTFIHAYSGRGVVESPLSAPWARRIVARFEFPKGN
jgi:NlpC/P60 family putative phage cell wall peptidase